MSIVPVRPDKNNTYEKISIILLSSNISYGMRTFGPKPLFKIKNKFLIEHQTAIIKDTIPNSEIILTIGYEANKIIKRRFANIRIVENQLFDTTNEVEQLRLSLNNIETDRVIIITGSVFFDKLLLKLALENPNSIIYNNKPINSTNEVGVTVVDGYATIFAYDIKTKWYPIFYLKDRYLKSFKQLCDNKDHNRLFMFEILNKLLNKTKLKAVTNDNIQAVNIETSTHLRKVQ